jgi:RNA polymerase nonessential primary-like sigma factor
MKHRNPRSSDDHLEIVDYFQRVGAVCSPTRAEGFETATRLVEARQAYRRTILSSKFVLEKCLQLLNQATEKKVRFDFAFELSQRETDKIHFINGAVPEIVAMIAYTLSVPDFFYAPDECAEDHFSNLIDLIETLDIRIGHLNQWHRELKAIVAKQSNSKKGAAKDKDEELTKNVFTRRELKANKSILAVAEPDFNVYLDAKQEMVRGAMKLVVSIAKRYVNSRLSLMDLVQEGNCGLLTAIEKYNPQLGFAFTTYATRWIQQKILIAVFEKSRTVRLPIVLSRKLASTERELEALAHANACFPNHDESIAAAKRQKVVARLLQIYRNSFVSIHGLTNDKGETSRGLELENDSMVAPETQLHRLRVVSDVQQAVSKLEGQKRLAMEMRFGLYGEPCSNQRIGDRLGISRETVRTLVKESLAVLRTDLGHLNEMVS